MQAFWLIAAVIFAVAEAATVQFVSIWFACGAVSAMVAAFITDNLLIQVSVFVLSSALFLLCTRKVVKKLGKNKTNTNADSLIGKTAILLERADNDSATGTLKINGVTWSVKTADGECIEAGTKVKIEKIEGVKLIVRKDD